LFSTVITAFISFVSTNIDDILVLMLFFSQINNIMKTRHIIIGQYLGIGTLTIISIVGALGISIIPHEYVGLLGLIPIYLGIKAYADYKKESKYKKNIENQENKNDENNKLEETTDIKETRIITFIKNFINPSVFKVASITFANGGDNVGIYVPLFTSMNLISIFTTVVMFVFLTALWCFIGKRLSEYPFVQRNIEKYKHIFIPIIFIGLGFFILLENGTITFIYKSIF